MEHVLKGYVDGWSDPSAFAMRYRIGHSSGTTEARFAGTGEYRLSSTMTAGHRPLVFTGRVAVRDVRELALTALRAGLWRAGGDTTPGGVDAEALIQVTAGPETFTVTVWTGDAALVRPFDAVQQRILRLVHRLTAGAVLEVGK
ncbi:hypothetical protein [Saccharothrix obliqua]|uniref:hypothetical protein n=1 Tax=Saccharothrix obliqua TaxID=2861747 RepID=UPI001C5D85A0|nr:hypothetical protein [Saccharothrix obliqua]MBW4720877.1 hypothetical protein [Saccharothrix obliqua]